MPPSSDDRAAGNQALQVMNRIVQARRLTIQWFVGLLVASVFVFWIFPRGSLVRTLFVWGSPLILIPILRPYERIRCPYCGRRPFLPSSKESFARWRRRTVVVSGICLHCDSDLTLEPVDLEPVRDEKKKEN